MDYGGGLIRVARRLGPAFARFHLVPGFGGLRKRPSGPVFAGSHPVSGFGGDSQAPSRGDRPFPTDPPWRKQAGTDNPRRPSGPQGRPMVGGRLSRAPRLPELLRRPMPEYEPQPLSLRLSEQAPQSSNI